MSSDAEYQCCHVPEIGKSLLVLLCQIDYWTISNAPDVVNDLDEQPLKNRSSECGQALPLLRGGNPASVQVGALVLELGCDLFARAL